MTFPLAPLSILGIGSVPFQERVDSCQAIFEEWDCPHWPQYPLRSLKENFVFQFLDSFPGLQVSDKEATFDETRALREIPAFQNKLNRAFSDKNFLPLEPPRDFALGYQQMKDLLASRIYPGKKVVKLQVTGPTTVWRSFFAERVSKKNSELVKTILFQTLLAKGAAQIQRTRSFGRVPIIFIDEPLRFVGLGPLHEMLQFFKSFDAWVGIHACSSSDWGGFDKLPLDFFHFDLTTLSRGTDGSRRFLRSLIGRKKWVVWGIVPTSPGSDFRGRDFSSILLKQIDELKGGGFQEEALQQSLLAPACGMGTLSPVWAEGVFRSLRTTVRKLTPYGKIIC